MQISVLGPVEVTADGRSVAIGKGKPRALLAVLALDEGSTVSSDRLVEALWGEDPPPTAAKMVQLYVSQVRKALAASGDGAEIVTRGRGYELRLGDGDVDALRFAALVADDMPREALALWRGSPLADVAEEPFAAGEIRRLEELRLTAAERAIDGDLAAGRHREVLGELEALVARDPLREGLQAQRMLALYRSGRQAQALQAYRQARSALVEQIGVEPGPALRELHDAILRQDPQLDPPGARIRAAAGRALRGHAAGGPSRPSSRCCARRGATRTPEAGVSSSCSAQAEWGRRGWPRSWRARCTATAPSCCTPPAPAMPAAGRAAISRAARARRPTLLVVDDVDRAGEEVGAALRELVEGLDALPVLVLATAQADDAPVAPRVDGTIALGPLGPDDVAVVARLYADPREDVEVPIADLMQDSGGVPRQVHQAAIEWSRARARPPPGRRRRAHGVASRRAARGGGRARGRCRRRAGGRTRASGSSRRASSSARSRASLRSSPRTPRSSSGASGSWRRWWPGWRARRCWASSGHRAAASRRCCAQGCSRPCARASCPAARAGRSPCCGRASIRCARCTTRLPRRPRRAGWCSPSISSRRPSWPAATRASARRSWTRSCDRHAIRADGRSCSWRSARTSTAAVPPIRSCGGCSAPTRRPWGRCAATSCAARSSCRLVTPGWRSSPT